VEFRILIKIPGSIPQAFTNVIPSDSALAINAMFKFNASLRALATSPI
jgi:hypothetical protein